MTKDIWIKLQNDNYFENHRLYNTFKSVQPSFVEEDDIRDKVVLDIGCGYGRHLSWFARYAKKCYGIDVSHTILNKAKQFLKGQVDITKIQLFLVDSYMTFMKKIDYAFCRFVFQHISKEETREYIKNITKLLKKNGKINFQFRIGNVNYIEKDKEPRVEYSVEEVEELLKKFIILKKEIDANNKHLYVIGIKK